MAGDPAHRLLAATFAGIGLVTALPAALTYCGLRPQRITPKLLRKMRRSLGKRLYVACVLACFEVPGDGGWGIPFFAALLLGGFGVGCLWFARGLWRNTSLGSLIVQSWALATFVIAVAWLVIIIVGLVYVELLREEGPVFY